jgi:hypothetical protein
MANTCPVCGNVLDESAASCPFCGYKMPGSTKSFKPIQIGTVGFDEQPAEHQAILSIIRGPQTGLDIELKPGTQTIGRNPQCDIFLNDMTVSRQHAVIESTPQGRVVRDTNSYNGVWVNDRIADESLLHTGDTIQIGAFCLLYKEN